MSQSRLLALSNSRIPVLSIVVLAAVFAVGMFVAGFDQGQIINTAFADAGIDPLVLHELTHDMRHAAGFPCH